MRAISASLILTAVLALFGVTAARAQATINDCEKIQAADAYNQCLAKFGPSGKNINVEAGKPGDVKGSAEEAAAGGGKPAVATGGGGRYVGRHRGYVRHGYSGGGGRKRATFTVRRRHH